MAYAGLVKRAKSHFENCNNGPEETPVQGDCSYILTPRATGAARPQGPNVKKKKKNKIKRVGVKAVAPSSSYYTEVLLVLPYFSLVLSLFHQLRTQD